MGLTFSRICRAHAAINLLTGSAILFDFEGAAAIMHGKEHGRALLGSTPEDKLAIGTAERLVGVLLIDIGLILGVVANVKDLKLQRQFCGVAIATHFLLAGWRVKVASKVPALKNMWQKQVVGDGVLAAGWVWYLVASRA